MTRNLKMFSISNNLNCYRTILYLNIHIVNMWHSARIREQVVAGGGVVDVAAIQALDHELPREAEVVANLQGLLVDVFGGEVLGDAAIIGVA